MILTALIMISYHEKIMQAPLCRAVITDCDLGSCEIEQEELAGIATVEISQCKTEEEVIAAAKEADGLLVQYAPITRLVIDSLPKCRVISRYGVGIEMIDLEAATRRGIAVCNVPGYCQEEVSDHACALMLALARKLDLLQRSVRQGNWDVTIARPVWRLRGQVLGLVGFGKIARLVARKMAGFGLTIIACDPHVTGEEIRRAGVEPVDLKELFSRADILSLHVPLTQETAHLLGAKELHLLKKGAFLINTSRGQLVDEKALYQALREGRLGGAALDVLEREPIPAGHPFLTLDNIIITPHAAFYSEVSIQELKRQTARAMARMLKGEPRSNGDTFCVVNQEAIRTRRMGG